MKSTDQFKAVHSLAILVGGLATVIVLATLRLIVDGETVAALSAVLSATMGTRALDKHGGDT